MTECNKKDFKIENNEDEKPKVFVGFCRLEIVDSDGLPKRTNGCSYQVPIHKTETLDGNLEFIALFPPRDPVHLFRLTSESSEVLTVSHF